MRAPAMAGRGGMTLVEMLVAMVVFGIVMAGAFSTLRSHGRSFSLGTEKMTALQNLRFAATTLETDLQTVGSDVPDEQPYLVYAGRDVIAFNANYTTNVANDVFAVYYDPDAPAGTVSALTMSQTITIPRTSFTYPDTSYGAAGMNGVVNSPAETIVFFFEPDATTSRSDDFVLYRQVNDLSPEIVARNLLQTSGEPFFQYYRVVTQGNGLMNVRRVADDALPLSHAVPIHLSPDDVGSAAVIDSLRGVRVSLTSTNGKTGDAERTRAIARLVRLPNAGLANKKTCGDEPLLGTPLWATPGNDPDSGDPVVTLTWNAATDEAGGEHDVVRYVIWRRDAAAADWGDPYRSIPSGNAPYTYVDDAVTTGQTFRYAIAAQDCTPSLSQLAEAGPVVVP